MKALVFFIAFMFSCISMAQSSTTTTYTNPITGITTTKTTYDYVQQPIVYQPVSAVRYTTGVNTSAAQVYPTATSVVYTEQELKQTAKEVRFAGCLVMKLDVDTDTLIESWTNTGITCIYKVDNKQTTISYKEIDRTGKVTKTWSYPIISKKQDEVTDSYTVNNGTGTITIVVWKDKRMIALEGADYTYLISDLND